MKPDMKYLFKMVLILSYQWLLINLFCGIIFVSNQDVQWTHVKNKKNPLNATHSCTNKISVSNQVDDNFVKYKKKNRRPRHSSAAAFMLSTIYLSI